MNTKAQTIEVLGKKYPFKFGMKFQRKFMEHFNIDLLSDYQEKIELASKVDTLSGQTAFGVFIIAAIQAASNQVIEFDVDDVIEDVLYKDEKKAINTLNSMVTAFQQDQPKQEPDTALGKSKK